jgi:hypothetical protein
MNRLSLCLTLALTAPLFGCGGSAGSPSGTLTVHGTLPPTTKALDNARAVAMGADGHTFAAYLTRTGGFTLNLPVGHAYMIVFANSRLDGSESVIGHLVFHTSNGAESFLGARAPGQIELGRISLAQGGSVVPQVTSGLKIACGCSSGGSEGGEGGGDYGCHEDDNECNEVCDDGGDDEMGSENEPGDDCESGDLDDEGGKSTCQQHVQQPCGGGSGSSSGSGSRSSSGGYSSSGSNSSSGGYSSSGGSSGGTPTGGGCHVNSDCGSGVCCGSACDD